MTKFEQYRMYRARETDKFRKKTFKKSVMFTHKIILFSDECKKAFQCTYDVTLTIEKANSGDLKK